MQKAVQIDFRGELPAGLREKIVQRIARLEDRFGRIVGCRVVLTAPSEHHRTGLYEIDVQLTLPNGKQVNVARTPAADERHRDIDFVVNDAFKRARRQLQDHVRRLQGNVKAHTR